MKIAIFGRVFDTSLGHHISEMFSLLEKNNVEVIVFDAFNKFLQNNNIIEDCYESFAQTDDLKGVDYVLSIGGDGTLLESATYVRELQIPILGINAGRLGFLATVTINKIPSAINSLLEGAYKIDERILLQLAANKNLFGDINFALNEFAILKRDNSSMIVIHTYIDGEFLNSYWSDGLIVSTPTGSTGYSLSCGGPLVMPKTSNFIISPVNPHNLNVRPMVVSDESTITFKIEGRSKKFLVAMDSRSKSVDATIDLSIQKAPFTTKLVELQGHNYFNTLRNKLNWGLDIRN